MMNKRGAIPVVAWIIIAVVGLLVANQTGLITFASFIPDVGQAVGTDSLVNPTYYGEAIATLSFACQQYDRVVLRHNFDSNAVPRSGDEFAMDLTGGNELQGYVMTSSSGGSNANSCGPCIYTFGNLCVQTNRVCKQTNLGISYRSINPASVTEVSTSIVPGNGGIEQIILAPSEDPKYTCRDGDVVLQKCDAFPNDFTVVQDCPASQACTFLSNQQTPDGITDVVRCGGTYVPNQNLCVGTTLHETNSAGSAITSQQCGFVCSNGECVECQDGAERCSQLPGALTDIEICQSGQWADKQTPGSTCVGLQQCVQLGSAASCESDFVNGQERCSVKQPQVYDGSSQTWVNNGDVCDLSCIVEGGEASCQNECEVGFICGGGFLQECIPSDRDNELLPIGACISGQCTADGQSCEPFRQEGTRYCFEGDVHVGQTTGNPDDLFGGVEGQLVQECSNGCEVDAGVVQCRPAQGCEGFAGQSICLDAATRAICAADSQSYTTTEDCSSLSVGGFCTVANNQGICATPEPDCTGTSFCSDGGVIRSCVNGAQGDVINSCNNLGCFDDSFGVPQCNNECEQLDTFSCIEGDSYTCVTDSQTGQLVNELTQQCGNLGCEVATGQCEIQCTGNSICSNGEIKECSSGLIGEVIDDCNNLGCSETSNTCTNECSASQLGSFTCKDGDSYDCVKKDNEQFIFELDLQCGNEGCSTASGRCVTSGEPDSFTCLGEALYSTDANGFLDNLVNTCGVADTSYCSEGVGYCKFCEQSQYVCGDRVWQQCTNEETGELTTVATCEAGCFIEDDQFKCDQLQITINTAQNFFDEEDVLIDLTLTGSQTDNGVTTPYTATLEGPGSPQVEEGSADVNGRILVNFGKKPLGEYIVTLDFADFPDKSRMVVVTVTNDFRIRLTGAQTITAIPGITPKTTIEALDADGDAPDDVIVTTSPSGVVVNARPSGLVGKWEIEVIGEPGIYTIGLSSVENGVTLEEQTIDIELRTPELTVSTNIPSTEKFGDYTFDISIVGPTAEGITSGLIPDVITATIAHSPAESLNLLDLGGGTYTFEFDFSDAGTYTIVVHAEKEGYESADSSVVIQISKSGQTTAPSGSSDTGTDGDTTSGDTGGTGGTGGTGLGGDNNQLIIVVIVGALIYFFFIRGKK